MHNLESIQFLIFSGLDSKLQEIGLKTWYFGKRNNKNSGRFAWMSFGVRRGAFAQWI